MTVNTFSSQFDVLLNSYAVPAAFGSTDSTGTIELDEYEKSLFLTKSQEDLAIGLYSGRNPLGTSFEETEEMRRYLSKLVKEAVLNPITTSTNKPLGIDTNSKFFTLPEDLWFITYESVSISDGKCAGMNTLEVYPVTQDEYHKIKRNPFRGANDRRSLRLDLSNNIVEIVSKYTVTKYYLRYLRKLQPIVLVNLDDGQSIGGVSTITECELPESLHQRILDGAVQLAIQSRLGGTTPSTSARNNNRE